MLLGRDRERAVIDRLLEASRERKAGLLVLRGEAGVGKTALLEYAADRATGMTVVRTVGLESEVELEFSGLLDVSRPLLGKLSELPPGHASALQTALGLAKGQAAERFAVGAATLALLAAAAEETPLLVLVDDVQWLDGPSADALMFALRRLSADRVAAVVTLRDGEGREFSPLGAEVIAVAGLPNAVARDLLAARLQTPPAADVVDRLCSLTNGNALALLELSELLTREELSGATPLEEPLRVGAAIENAYTRRLERLGAETRRAVVVAAAGSSLELDVVARGLEALGIAVGALEAAEDAGLLRLDADRVAFTHPLVRSAVFHSAPPSERRLAHRVLAEALRERGRDVERAWHLAGAALGPDDEAATALAAVAARGTEEGRDREATLAWERAARLTSEVPVRVERLERAAAAAFGSGSPRRAAALADEALALCRDPVLRARLVFLRGRAEVQIGVPRVATALLLESADLAREADPAAAAGALAFAAAFAIHAGDGRLAVEAARRAHEVAPAGTEAVVERPLGEALTFAGSAEGRQFLERSLVAEDGDPADFLQPLAAAVALTLLDRVAEAQAHAAEATRRARVRGPGAAARTLEPAAWSDLRAGRWDRAVVAATEGRALAADMRSPSLIALMSAILAQIAAARGDEPTARALAGEALALAEEHQMRLVEQWSRYAAALLELAVGRPDVALQLLTSIAERMAEMALVYRDVAPEPDLVELHTRLGNKEEAGLWLAAWSDRTGEWGSRWADAVSARCRGLVAADDRFPGEFDAALEAHGDAEDRFAEARTRLCYGERLRRAGARVDAREQLRAALGSFEELRAEPWAARARTELRASGEKLRRRQAHEGEELTPQELQIALQVAEGKTNKDVGAALFLSPKTIEFHLNRVYRKLGITSRGELIRRFATSPQV